jgi:hypothetical protein
MYISSFLSALLLQFDLPFKPIRKVIAATIVVCIHQPIAAYIILFDNVPTACEVRIAKKHACELSHYKKNVLSRYGSLTTNLKPIPALEHILRDMNRLTCRM